MNKLSFTLIAFIFIAGVMVMTCPGEEMHKKSIKRLANVAMEHEIDKNAEYLTGIGFLDKWIGGKVSDYMIDNWMSVENYFVLSIGYINIDGDKEMVSVGAFNHIFTMDEHDVKEGLDRR